MLFRRISAAALLVALLFSLAACGDDGETADDSPGTTAAAETIEPATEGEEPEETVATVPIDDACALVPDAAGVSGLALGEGVADGDERRRVCAFSATVPGQPALTIGVQGGGRYDEKAEQSADTLGDPGEEVDGIGDRAVFFFADDDIPEGVGGMLVEVGDLTVEVTLQNVDEATMRQAATSLAELAVSNL